MKYRRKERGHYRGEKSREQGLTSAKDLPIELPEGSKYLGIEDVKKKVMRKLLFFIKLGTCKVYDQSLRGNSIIDRPAHEPQNS